MTKKTPGKYKNQGFGNIAMLIFDGEFKTDLFEKWSQVTRGDFAIVPEVPDVELHGFGAVGAVLTYLFFRSCSGFFDEVKKNCLPSTRCRC